MSRRGAYLVVLAAGFLPGCMLFESGSSSAWMSRLRPGQTGLTADAVQLHVALLELPIGDLYLNGELWTSTDQQVVSPESKVLLDDNGFRVGHVVGTTPAKLQALLTSERSCIKPRLRVLRAGATATQELRSDVRAEFWLKLGDRTENVSLEKALFQLDIVPTLAGDGRVHLRFTPKVQYGEPMRTVNVPPDRTDWQVKIERPQQAYPQLAWEVTLAANEFLLVGGRYDQPGSLGYRSFVDEEGRPVQRLLVIRPNRALPGQAALEDLTQGGQAPPLALQATMTAVRASRQ